MNEGGWTESDFTREGDIAFLFANGEPTAINLNHLVYAQVCGEKDHRHVRLTMSAIEETSRGPRSVTLKTDINATTFDRVILDWQKEKEAAK